MDKLKATLIKKVLEKALHIMDIMNSSLVRMREEPNWGDYNDYAEKISDLRREIRAIELMPKDFKQ